MENVNYIHKGKNESRVLEINFVDKKFSTPTYFPSISSAVTRIPISWLIRFCVNENYPKLLVSAYDLDDIKNEQNSIMKILKNYAKKNILFVDSGTFESYWLKDKEWTFDKYNKIITKISGDIYTSFDKLPKPYDNLKTISSNINSFMKKSSIISKKSHCAMVLHGNIPSQIINAAKNNVFDNANPLIYTIPERDCGKTIKDKITTIKKIRIMLNKKNPANILHILGCGNPLSIALFTFVGADSFDSVDWSRWVIDPKTLQFVDLNHIELIECDCKICQRKKLDAQIKPLLHNILFYQKFMSDLQTAILDNSGLELLKNYVDDKTFSKIIKLFK